MTVLEVFAAVAVVWGALVVLVWVLARLAESIDDR